MSSQKVNVNDHDVNNQADLEVVEDKLPDPNEDLEESDSIIDMENDDFDGNQVSAQKENLNVEQGTNKIEEGNTNDEQKESKRQHEEEGGFEANDDVNRLMEMDLNSENKDEIIDILMKDNIVKKKELHPMEAIKKKNNKKFKYVTATVDRNGLPIKKEEEDYREQDKNEINKILNEGEVHKEKKYISRKQIGDKVNQFLEKKQRDIERIQEQMKVKQNEESTFTPTIISKKREKVKKEN